MIVEYIQKAISHFKNLGEPYRLNLHTEDWQRLNKELSDPQNYSEARLETLGIEGYSLSISHSFKTRSSISVSQIGDIVNDYDLRTHEKL